MKSNLKFRRIKNQLTDWLVNVALRVIFWTVVIGLPIGLGITIYKACTKKISDELTVKEFKGHSYIIMKTSVPYKGYGGITHNPDCGCNTK